MDFRDSQNWRIADVDTNICFSWNKALRWLGSFTVVTYLKVMMTFATKGEKDTVIFLVWSL